MSLNYYEYTGVMHPRSIVLDVKPFMNRVFWSIWYSLPDIKLGSVVKCIHFFHGGC